MKRLLLFSIVLAAMISFSCNNDDAAKVLADYEGNYELESVTVSGYDQDIDLNGDELTQKGSSLLLEFRSLMNYKNELSVFNTEDVPHKGYLSGRLFFVVPSQLINANGPYPYGFDSDIDTGDAKSYDPLLMTCYLKVDTNGTESWGEVNSLYPNPPTDDNLHHRFENPSIVSANSNEIVLRIEKAVFYNHKNGDLFKADASYTFRHIR